MQKKSRTVVTSAITLVLLVVALLSNAAAAQSLYDGDAASLPTAQGWTYLTNPFIGANATQTLVTGGVELNTTAVMAEQAGYFGLSHPSLPAFNSDNGFALPFSVRMNSESHNSNDRAGFSVIAVDQNLKAIELGFWENLVWAQNDLPLFQQAEGVAFDTTSMTTYRLEMLNNNYQLFANEQVILSGPLRDYSAFAGFPDVYETANFLFLGDNTSSAMGSTVIANIDVVDLIEINAKTVPYPAAVPIILLILMTVGRVWSLGAKLQDGRIKKGE